MSHCKLIVFYDGACPSCVTDRGRYESWLGRRVTSLRERQNKVQGEEQREQVEWFDITGQEETLRGWGIDPEQALRELHVRDQDGRIHRELDAYILLFNQVWWLKPVAWLMSFKWIKAWLSTVYRRNVDARLARSKEEK